MAGQVNYNGSSITATIPAISSTVFASGMSGVITNRNSSALTISSTPTINGCGASGSLGQYGFLGLVSNGTSLDGFCFPGFGTITNGALVKFGSAGGILGAGDLSGDVTTSGSLVTTVAKIAGVTVSGTTGTTNAVFSASPTFTGTPIAPTASVGTNTTQIATTAFVQSQMVASGAGVSTWNTRAGAVVLQQADITAVGALHDVGRNRLHNAGFSINQRGYTSGTALAAGAYAHDRWKAGSGGCTYTFTQTQPFTTITITAGSLQQIVEAMNVEGGTYTLSWTGTAQGRVNAGTYAASPVTVTGLAVNTAITVEFNTGTLGRIQLEVGSVATPLEKPDPRYDLANCQRFAFMLQSFGFGSGAYSGGIVFYVPFNFPVPMRTNPTASGGTWTGVTNCSATTFASTSQHSALLAITASAIGQVIATLNNALFSADL
jgi:hypothetical protein